MRLLFDEDLSYRIAEQLHDAGHDAVHVTAVGLDDTDDDVILAWATRERRVVVNADADFSEMVALAEADGPSLLQFHGRGRPPKQPAGFTWPDDRSSSARAPTAIRSTTWCR